ncbi:hypothetical protein ZIOFF_068381 [Zingiber officinale]|uniref:dUTP diphosphatase n=1 Tax=Zingiber officinale TaxID=94328 RepID=A0A8J5CEN1_ZINOF|nr:hypothetical protein ZIOFF_068381 [Zingiber officinale]
MDFDFRDEVKILAFNGTKQHIFLHKHECIAQIILENISTLEIYEVESSDDTVRDANTFGSTSEKHIVQLRQQLTTTWLKTKVTSSIPADRRFTKPRKPGRWDTLGEPSGKFDYHVNYAIPEAIPDLELPTPSWDDNPCPSSENTIDHPPNDIIRLLCPPEVTNHYPSSSGAYAGDTRPRPSVHRSIGYPMTTDDEFLATFLEDTSNSDAEDIQDSLNFYFSSS